MQSILDAAPSAFYAGCAAARDEIEQGENPYVAPTQKRAWAAGWLSVREGWAESMSHGGSE